MTLKTTLENLAKTVSDRAKDATTPFTETIDALKALTHLYGIFLKDKGNSADDSGEFTMAEARSMIEDEAHGEPIVRNRRGRANQ